MLLSLVWLVVAAITTVEATQDGDQSKSWNLARPQPTVSVESGPLVGTTTSLPSATASVAQFLGVPFADKPKRFLPPAKSTPWTKPRKAQKWKKACIQQFNNGPNRNFTISVYNTPAPIESEDCLYLNVYAPTSPAQGRGRPVMFWLYGGSLQFGHAGQTAYDGSFFASYQDVVVVTTNYRTNVFGFPGDSEIPLRQRNLGFLDQRLALDWVQRNIDVFGGDPDKITIFGESAGAFSVDALLTSYGQTERPPFRAAILQSGQISYRGTPSNPSASTSAWEKLAKELGCKGNRTLTCLSSNAIKSEQIKKVIEENNLIFSPVADNRTLISAPALRRAMGAIARVPVLIGSNSQEGRVFVQGQSDVNKYVQTTFGNNSAIVKTVLDAYPVGKNELYTQFDAIAQIMTEFSFQCSTALFANISASVGIPTWRYYFNATFPNLQTFPKAGVFHSSEIRLVFGTYAEGSKAPSPPEEVALSEFIQGAWARFAKDPWSGPGWTAVGNSPSGNDLGDIGSYGETGVRMIRASDVDKRCGIYTPLYKKVAGL